MKTFYFSRTNISTLSLFGILTLIATSCGSYQNTSYYDNDGVYGSSDNSKPREIESNNSGYYKEYFSSLNKDSEVFTNVDNYSSAQDSVQKQPEVVTNSNYAGWGSNSSDNVTINVYNNGGWNNWGYYNIWAGNNWGYYNNWGWNNGWYGNYWGYNNWYGPSWGWGWNNWYGPGWNGYYGYYGGYYGGYGYYNIWGWYNGNLGYNYAHSGGRRNMNRLGGNYQANTPGDRGNITNGGRNTRVFGSRDYNSTSPRSNYNSNNTPRSNYNSTPRSNNSSPRTNYENNSSPRSNYNENNTPRNYTPSNSNSNPRSYTPQSTNSSPRSYTPAPTYSSPSPSGGGGFGGGRSGGGGRR